VRQVRGTDRISWRRHEITFGRRNFVAKLPRNSISPPPRCSQFAELVDGPVHLLASTNPGPQIESLTTIASGTFGDPSTVFTGGVARALTTFSNIGPNTSEPDGTNFVAAPRNSIGPDRFSWQGATKFRGPRLISSTVFAPVFLGCSSPTLPSGEAKPLLPRRDTLTRLGSPKSSECVPSLRVATRGSRSSITQPGSISKLRSASRAPRRCTARWA